MPPDSPTPFRAVAAGGDVRGVRPCEIFVVERHLLQGRGQVSNTLGLNDRPGARWPARGRSGYATMPQCETACGQA